MELTGWEKDVLKLAEKTEGILTLSTVQRKIPSISFAKACEVVKSLSDKGLIKSNIDQLNLSV